MATLTETAVITRKIIRYTVYAVILIVIARYTYLLGMKIYRTMFPPPPPEPTVCWGKLPSIQFPKKDSYENLTFILETPDLSLPELQPQANVYFIPKPFVNIQSIDRGKKTAEKLGFNPDGRELSDTTYLFEEEKGAPSTLTMNLVTDSFSITYDIKTDPTILKGKAPVPQSAINMTKTFLGKAGLMPKDISAGTPQTEFIKVEDGEFVGAISLSEAQVIKVNFFRQDYNELPVKTLDPNEGNIWFIVGSSGVIVGEYHYFALDTSKDCTYPLKTAKDAWDDLNTGNGFIADLGDNTKDAEIKIRRVYLAYFDPGSYQEYFQPIVVFEGDNGFIAYVNAIATEFSGADAITPSE